MDPAPPAAGAVPGQGSVAQAMSQARQAGLDRLDAQLLLAHALDRPRSWLLAHDDQVLSAEQQQRFDQHCQLRGQGVPVAYLLGQQGFYGLNLQVNPAVLVPRPDTETLVDWALATLDALQAQQPTARPRVLDLGTGSGAIALAVAHRHTSAQLTATDASAQALAVARANAQALGLPVRTLHGSWWQALPAQEPAFDLVLSNPPYIAGDDPHLLALQHEPRQALTPEGDGLAALRAIVAGAADHLRPGGWLLLEHGFDQAQAVQALLTMAGFDAVGSVADLAGHLRCSGGHRPVSGQAGRPRQSVK